MRRRKPSSRCPSAFAPWCSDEHATQDGGAKILERCTLPLTALRTVKMITTELAVFRFLNGRPVLCETALGVSLDEVCAKTETHYRED